MPIFDNEKTSQAIRALLTKNNVWLIAAQQFWGVRVNDGIHDEILIDVPKEHRAVVARLMIFAEDQKAYPDPYRAVAACRYNVGYDAVTWAQREIIKRALFTHIYGSNPAQLKKLIDEAKEKKA